MSLKPNNNACFVCSQTPVRRPGISLHRFPSNREQRTLWLTACGLSENDYRLSRRICSLHFEDECFNKYNFRKCLYPGSVPTKFLSANNNRRLITDVHKQTSRYSALTSQHGRYDYEKPLRHINRSPYVSPTFYINRPPSPYVSPSLNVNRSPSPYVSPSCSTSQFQSISPSSNTNLPQNVSPVRKDSPPPLLEEKPFCPITMMRYDNTNGYSTMWVCRICMCALLSEKAAQNHFVACKLPSEMSDVDEDEVDEEYDDNSENEYNNKGQDV